MKLGIKPGDWVLLQFPNWYEYILTFFAMQKIGAATLLLIPRHNQSEINHLANLTKPVAWVVPKQYGKIDYQPIIDDVLKENPQLKHIIQVRAEKNGAYPTLDELIERAELTPKNLKALAARRPDPDEVSHIMPTGGTTGLPKASVRTHNSYITNVEYHAKAWEITSNDTLIVITPVGHSMAMHWGIGAALLNYAKLVLLDSTQGEDICACIEKERVTAVPSVPALITRLLTVQGLERYDLSSLKKICLGGAPSTPELLRSCLREAQMRGDQRLRLFRGHQYFYEAGRQHGCHSRERGSARLPVRHDQDHRRCGKEVPQGAEGELVSKGPGIFTGYFKSPEENSEIFTKDGFFKTGDKARKDPRGISRSPAGSRTSSTGAVKRSALWTSRTG